MPCGPWQESHGFVRGGGGRGLIPGARRNLKISSRLTKPCLPLREARLTQRREGSLMAKILNKIFFDAATKIGTGNYTGIHNCLDFLMEPTGEGGPDSNKPSHVIYFETPRGPVEIGKAWTKKTKTGETMYSVTMDDGDLSRILNFAAYGEKDATGHIIPGEFNVVRERHRREQVAA